MDDRLTWEQICNQARNVLAPKCMVCPVCNGRSCAGKAPGPGGKGSGSTFMRNYDYLHNHVRLHMDVLGDPFTPDITTELLGKQLSLPVLAAPIGMVALNLSDTLNEYSYAKAILEGMLQAGSLGITGGGPKDESFFEPLRALKELDGRGIPSLKPWRQDLIFERLPLVKDAGADTFLIDIDSAGLPHAGMTVNPLERKGEAALAEIVQRTDMKFLVKGIMTPQAAIKAVRAGASGIVVSNHGGRVIDNGLSTAEVLPVIREAIGSAPLILVDGGVRSGMDVFKMLALGANAVLIGRPYSIAAFGGGSEGVFLYTEKIRTELMDAMLMTGCESVHDIDRSKIQFDIANTIDQG